MVVLATLPVIVFPVTSNTTKIGFKIELVISNTNPTVRLVNATNFAVDPIAATTTQIIIVFNATDSDTVEQINGTSGGRAYVNLTLGTPSSSQFRSSSTCTNTTYGSGATGVVTFNCSILMQYFDNASSNWVINITVIDSNSGTSRNDSQGSAPHTFIYNSLSSLSFPNASINFTNVNLGQQDAASNPLVLNNTGNDDFDQINITAAALIGTTTASETIAATNFFANTTNAAAGKGVQLGTSPVILRELEQGTGLDNATLMHGHTSAFAPNADKGNRTLFFWVDVPASGLSSQLYNATWNLTVIDLP